MLRAAVRSPPPTTARVHQAAVTSSTGPALATQASRCDLSPQYLTLKQPHEEHEQPPLQENIEGRCEESPPTTARVHQLSVTSSAGPALLTQLSMQFLNI